VIRPGLAKARGLPLVLTRRGTFVRAPDPRWRQLFERADAVSEGSVREEDAGRVWYGSTSLILSIDPADAPGSDPAFLATLVRRDSHARLRALRTAHREACSRAPCRLGRFTCEIRVQPDARGVRIDVDVQAPLIETRAYWKSAR
jgi:hypothetical protein